MTETQRNQDEKTLLLQFFGCQGMMEQNMQQVLSNEPNNENGFYKAIPVEQKVRQQA